MIELAQEDIVLEAEGAVTYPDGTRLVTLVVPPGVLFVVPDGVLVESDRVT